MSFTVTKEATWLLFVLWYNTGFIPILGILSDFSSVDNALSFEKVVCGVRKGCKGFAFPLPEEDRKLWMTAIPGSHQQSNIQLQ